MENPIVSPEKMKASKVIGRITECQRMLEEAGLPFQCWQWPVDDADFRARLVEFWTSRCGKQQVTKKSVPVREYKVLRPVAPKPGTTEPHLFKSDNTFFNKKSGVKMLSHGSNFTDWFAGKVEKDVPEGNLKPFMLTQPAYDREIIADLGGEEKAETTLAEIWRLMQYQASGEGGVLLTNGWANIFYVRDTSGVLRAVGVDWGVGGWCADAVAVGDRGWRGAYQVFSRNS